MPITLTPQQDQAYNLVAWQVISFGLIEGSTGKWNGMGWRAAKSY
jgi:hypothetical protein